MKGKRDECSVLILRRSKIQLYGHLLGAYYISGTILAFMAVNRIRPCSPGTQSK